MESRVLRILWQCFHLMEEESDVKCTNAKTVEQKNSNKRKHINDGFASPGSMGMTSCEFMQWAKQNGYTRENSMYINEKGKIKKEVFMIKIGEFMYKL